MRLRAVLLGWSAAIWLAFGVTAAPVSPPKAASAAAPAFVHRIILKLRDSGSPPPLSAARLQRQALQEQQLIAALAARNNISVGHTRSILPGLHVMDIAPQSAGESLQTTLARLRADPAVQYAEPDQRRHVLAAPNDPLYVATPGATGQWYLQNPTIAGDPSAVDAIDAWTTATGSNGLVIADIDTGVRFDHPDLLRAGAPVPGRLLPGYTFISDVLTANDGAVADTLMNASWDADASDPGDWITQADTQLPDFSQCSLANSTWHGTRVVGILGAITNNSIGIAGLTWSGWLLPVRALGKCGGADSDIESAMLWAAGMQVEDDTGAAVPLNPYPARIINLSLGAVGSCPSSYAEVINTLATAGVTVVAAAGNEGGPVDAPANCPNVIAVAGLRQAGTKVGFSSLGPEIALSAPGGNCVNTTGACLYSIDTTTNLGVTTPGANSYTNQTNISVGTSFATPMVTGIAGLMLSVNANLSPAQIASRLQASVTPFPVGAPGSTVPICQTPSSSNLQTFECYCTTTTCGAGMANADGAVTAALRPIAALLLPNPIVAGPNVFHAAGSAAACMHSIASYSWSVIDGTATGSISGPANGSSAMVVAPTSGSFTVQVVVADDAGHTDTAQAVLSSTTATSTAPASAGTSSSACLTPITPTLPVTVTVSPSSATAQSGLTTQAFSAAVTGNANTTVTWQVNGIAGGDANSVGTISTSGVYTPPVNLSSSPTVSVVAVSVADPTKTGFAGVTITPPVAVSVAPATAVVLAATGSQQFTATLANAGSNTAVSWQVNGIAGGNATVGTISSAGVYAAPATIPSPATVTVTAVSAADPTRSGSAAVTVAYVSVAVVPSVATVMARATQPFVASVMNTSNIGVTWFVNGSPGGNASAGTVSTSGVYTAPATVPSPPTVTVVAVSMADSTRSGSAQVTVTAASSSGGASTSSGGGGAMTAPSLLALAALTALAVGARRRQLMPAEGSMQRPGFLWLMLMTTSTLALLGAAPTAHGDSRWTAGVHYFVINPAQPTGLPSGKIEVTEVFSYACPGCNRFYPVADRLQASLPANAVMDYLPAAFRPDEDWPMFQRAYLTAKEMGIDQRSHDAMFDAVWKTGELAVLDPATQRAKRPAPGIADAAGFYAKVAGVKPEAFLATAGSFAVDVKVRQADELIRNYGVSETPSIVVNGKYRLNPVSAGGYEQTIELVKWLVQQETRPGDKK
ncbi:MAG TPA: S8 family serine peptidase [Steroidobacteraceae bacterium]|jgi:serine protease|nr:S8 family serine peptidase [Steroidobacteraceae bacterium]